jgi:DNA helicase-2/ATP-dependent DNA helicase PcrA
LADVLIDPLLLKNSGIASRTIKKMNEFAQSMVDLGARLGSSSASMKEQQSFFDAKPETSVLDAEKAVSLALDVSGLAEYFASKQSEDADVRLDNIHQLVSAAKQYVEDSERENRFGDVLGFLEGASLLSAADEQGKVSKLGGAVTLMTLHAAKGLEFDLVFMIGMEEYGFPHSRALEYDASEEQLEEERRLAYVGITRARKKLILTYSDRRMIRGVVKARTPSRFLKELPSEHVIGDLPRFKDAREFEPFRQAVSDSSSFRVEIDPEFALGAQSDEEMARGQRVFHQLFGNGVVVEKRGAGTLLRAVVCFDVDRKQRTIIAKHLRLI